MKLFKPQLQLARESVEQPDESFRYHYYLHVVTFTDYTNYRAEDYDVDTSALETEGVINVKVYVYPDPDIPNFKYLTPVVHTIDLGLPGESEMEFVVNVDVINGLPDRGDPPGENSSGSSQTGSTGADEDGRPGGN